MHRISAADAQCGAMEWILSGSREVEISGLQGKEFIVRGASVVQFRDDQIVRCSDYWDFAAFARNFGLK
jgi:ketosteroid isomerase-like protein